MTTEAGSTDTIEEALAPAFLGWRIVAVAFAAQFVFSATGIGIVGNLVGPMSQTFGVAPTSVGMAPAYAILLMGLLGPLLGRAMDAGYARPMMTAGGLMTGLGLVAMSFATTMGQVGAAFVLLLCPGSAMFGSLPAMTLVSNWFVRRRGLALGVTVAGATLSSGFAPVLAGYLIETEGWRRMFLYFGTFTAAVSVPLFSGFVIARPEEVGQRPDGDSPESEAEGGAEAATEGLEPLPTRELARDFRLWLQAAGYGLVLTSPVVMIAVLVPYAEEVLGLSQVEAGLFFTAMVPFSLAGKVIIGGLADVAPLKPAIGLVVVANALVWWLLRLEPDYTLFLVTGAIYGIGIGGAAPLHGVLIGRLFGRANFGTASGLGGIVGVPLLALANIATQTVLASTGSYADMFLMQIGFLVLGGLLLLPLRIPSPDQTR